MDYQNIDMNLVNPFQDSKFQDGAVITPVSHPDQRRTRKPEEVAQILGIGRNAVYELIRTRQLHSIAVGRKLLVPLSAIDVFLTAQSAE